MKNELLRKLKKFSLNEIRTLIYKSRKAHSFAQAIGREAFVNKFYNALQNNDFENDVFSKISDIEKNFEKFLYDNFVIIKGQDYESMMRAVICVLNSNAAVSVIFAKKPYVEYLSRFGLSEEVKYVPHFSNLDDFREYDYFLFLRLEDFNREKLINFLLELKEYRKTAYFLEYADMGEEVFS